MDENKFNYVLEENIILDKICIKNNIYDKNAKLILEIEKFCKSKKKNIFIISLSGGVDSMVLATIIHLLGYQVICIHINYNNRNETIVEAEFIKYWTDKNNIELIYKNIENIKRGEINREVYEETTKKTRFDVYKEVLTKYQETDILLGHHKDDIIENVFNNICRGRNLLELPVIKKENKLFNVNICRPLIIVHKDEILSFALLNDVPYFKNTTPSHCMRGVFREQIYPLLNSSYNNLNQNLLSISRQSDEWNFMIEEKIIEPFYKTINFTKNIVIINIKDYRKSNYSFWNVIFCKIWHNFQRNAPSKKSLNNFLSTLSTKNENFNFKLTNNTTTHVNNNDEIIITFI